MASVGASASGAGAVPVLHLPRLLNAPVVDGRIGDAEWRGSVLRQGQCEADGRMLFPAPISFRIGRDATNLYFAACSYVPPEGLVRRVPARAGSTVAFLDDSYEFLLASDGESDGAPVSRIVVNANGAVFAEGFGEKDVRTELPAGLVVRSGVSSNAWETEISLPLATVGFAGAGVKGINVRRNWKRTERGSVTTEWVRGFHRVLFDDSAPAVEVLQMGGGDSRSSYPLRLRVTNPANRPQAVKVELGGRPLNSQPAHVVRTETLPPRESREFEMTGPVLGEEPVEVGMRVSSTDGGTVHFFRRLSFRPNAATIRFREPFSRSDKIGFSFAYYPYHNKMRVVADLKGLDAAAGTVTLAVRPKSGEALATTEVPVGGDRVAETIWTIPDLAETTRKTGRDDYEIVLKVPGLKDVSVVRPFKRGVFEWEGNKLGLSGAVPAPFKPVKSEKGKVKNEEVVSVVLREHTVDKKTGLWKQVTAAGKDLLARPMAFVSAGPTPTPSTYTYSTEWDVDGLMDWRLTLKPGHYEPMSLEIPIRAERAKLMHACIDGLRSNYAGAVPAGPGRVWTGAMAEGRESILGDYVPYIWIGGPLRGIAVFGENDKGWEVGGQSCQEIIRESDGTVVLRLNLIQRACDITEARTIRIGFQATPVKPMAEGWRRQWKEPYSFYGCCWSWGGLGDSGDVCPYDGTTEFWEKMVEAQRTGKVDEAFLKRFMAGYPYSEKPGSPEYLKKKHDVETHYASGMGGAASRHGHPEYKVLAYTNGRGVRYGTPEGRTFCDEWHRAAFMSRNYSEDYWEAYELDPVPSYLDYAAWWWKKALELGVINYYYWDDVFCRSNFDLVGTDAYKTGTGEIQPSSGIFNMRAQVKRCAVLQTEMGLPATRNWIHMTNTALAPVSAFAGVHYDWEHATRQRDMQARYTREYILACTIGRQFGVRVNVIGKFLAEAEDVRRFERHAIGPMLCFELGWGTAEYKKTREELDAWGYGCSEGRVWNYWDEDEAYPVAVRGPDHVSIAMTNGKGEALVVVSDWNGGGAYAVEPDCAALGVPKNFKAVDFRTGKPLRTENGKVLFELETCDYVILRLH